MTIIKAKSPIETITNILTGLQGAKIVKLTVDVKCKTYSSCPFKNVHKKEEILGLVNFYYNEGVLRRLRKETGKKNVDFKRGTSWHTAILDKQGKLTPFCSHKKTGEVYIRLMHLKTVACQYFAGPKRIDTDDVLCYTYPHHDYPNQGLQNPLVFLTIKLSNIKELKVDGKIYK